MCVTTSLRQSSTALRRGSEMVLRAGVLGPVFTCLLAVVVLRTFFNGIARSMLRAMRFSRVGVAVLRGIVCCF